MLVHIHTIVAAILCVVSYWRRNVTNWLLYHECIITILASSFANTASYNYDNFDIIMILMLLFIGLYNGDAKTIFLITLCAIYVMLFTEPVLYLRSNETEDVVLACIMILGFVVTILSFALAITHIGLMHQRLHVTN